MKPDSYFLFLSIAMLAVAGCQSPQNQIEAKERRAITESKLVYGLRDDALNFLGNRLGCQVEALGIGEYSFAKGRQVFQISVRNDMLAQDRIRATELVLFNYEPPEGGRILQIRISVAQDITLTDVEKEFRGFMRQMQKAKT